MEQNTQQDRAKLLEQQAREYLMQSKDPIFIQYVQQLIPRIQKRHSMWSSYRRSWIKAWNTGIRDSN